MNSIIHTQNTIWTVLSSGKDAIMNSPGISMTYMFLPYILLIADESIYGSRYTVLDDSSIGSIFTCFFLSSAHWCDLTLSYRFNFRNTSNSIVLYFYMSIILSGWLGWNMPKFFSLPHLARSSKVQRFLFLLTWTLLRCSFPEVPYLRSYAVQHLFNKSRMVCSATVQVQFEWIKRETLVQFICTRRGW